jgi:hypothetical protein
MLLSNSTRKNMNFFLYNMNVIISVNFYLLKIKYENIVAKITNITGIAMHGDLNYKGECLLGRNAL